MSNVSDYIGQSYQRYSVGARFTVGPNPRPPYDPGLVESDRGEVFYLSSDGELTNVAAEGGVRGGLETVHTDANGQATVQFHKAFPERPDSIITTPRDNLVATGTLELTRNHVIVWVWDLVVGDWYADKDVELYWMGLFN